MGSATKQQFRRRRWSRSVVGATVLLVVLISAFFARAYIPEADALVAILDSWGQKPLYVYIIIYTGLSMVLVPIAFLLLSSGLILGNTAIPIILIATVSGAALSFLIARTFFAERVHTFVARRPRLAAIEAALADDVFRLIIFMRMSPAMPFGMLNYVGGALPISLGRFTLATFLGLLPRATLGVLVASGGRAVLEAGSLSALGPQAILAYGIIIFATLAVIVVLGRVAKRALDLSGIDGAGGLPGEEVVDFR